MTFLLVLCTCPRKNAEHLAHALVEEKLAACVNIIDSLESVYRWQGKIQQDQEALLLIKTRQRLWNDLECFIHEHHPYEVPEIIALPIVAGSTPYLSWIEENTCES